MALHELDVSAGAPAERLLARDRPTLPRVRMLHTSDVHVSADMWGIDALRAVVTAAIALNVDIVLIAGDLFDNSRVTEGAVRATLAELARLRQPVVVVPGNHDCVDDQSIYHRVDLADAGPHVWFVGDPEGRTLFFEDLALAVWGRGIKDHEPRNRPLDGCPLDEADLWRVAVTHGHFVPEGETSIRSSQIHAEEIAALECHYLALGHWHRFTDVSQGEVAAFYSGSPSEPGVDGATANLVTLDPELGVQVEQVRLGEVATS